VRLVAAPAETVVGENDTTALGRGAEKTVPLVTVDVIGPPVLKSIHVMRFEGEGVGPFVNV
jgi:hypothetical protein